MLHDIECHIDLLSYIIGDTGNDAIGGTFKRE
jgi:hypothetical protein